jgi:hypothetical protein
MSDNALPNQDYRYDKTATILINRTRRGVAPYDAIAPQYDRIFSDTESLKEYVGNQAIKMARLWEVAEGLWDAGDLNAAAGVYLDRLAAFVNVSRQKAVGTLVYTALWGAGGTVIPKGHLTRLLSGERFRLASAVTIGTHELPGFSFKVTDVIVGAAYSFQLAGALISYTAADGDTQESIQAALYAPLDQRFTT